MVGAVNLYHLHREATGWDEQLAVVVRAPDETYARAFAATACGNEGPNVWLGTGDESVSWELLARDVDGLPGIVCRCFRHG